ncbi:MAG: recombinase family protein, partial [Parafilimonas terrae]|nr:recombinase family protein [Parafilimonas terrae]
MNSFAARSSTPDPQVHTVPEAMPAAEGPEALRERLLASAPFITRKSDRARPVLARSASDAAVIYTRYSTTRQFELSTTRQVEDATGYLQRSGLALAEDGTYSDEGRSGRYIAGREQLDAMLKRCKSDGNIRAVVIADPSRLSRDMVDLAWLHRKLARMGIELHSAASGRLDAGQVVLHAFLSQQQVQTLVHVTRHARRAMVRVGKVPWGPRTFGYERDGHVPGNVKPCGVEAEIVRDIFRLSASGVSDVRIALVLNGERRLGRRKNDWDDASVRRVLNNPMY